jgi:hypothetical protein
LARSLRSAGTYHDYADAECLLADGLAILRQQDHLQDWDREERQQAKQPEHAADGEKDQGEYEAREER